MVGSDKHLTLPPGIVAVLWWDAAFEMDTPTSLGRMCTLGWIVRQTDKEVVIASEDMDYSDARRAYTAVPACDIIRIVPLRSDDTVAPD